MAEIVLPVTGVTALVVGANVDPFFPTGANPDALSDASDTTGINLHWHISDTDWQVYFRGDIDGSAIPVGSTITGMSWRFKYDHDYADPVPAFTTVRFMDSVNFNVTISGSLPEVAAFTEVDVPVIEASWLSLADLQAGFQVDIHRQNSDPDTEEIRVSEASLVVTYTPPTPLTELCENFEAGSEGGEATESNTGFDTISSTPADVDPIFTTDSRAGLAITGNPGASVGHIIRHPDITGEEVFPETVVNTFWFKVSDTSPGDQAFSLFQVRVAEVADPGSGIDAYEFAYDSTGSAYGGAGNTGSGSFCIEHMNPTATDASADYFTAPLDTWLFVEHTTYANSTFSFSVKDEDGVEYVAIEAEAGPTGYVFQRSSWFVAAGATDVTTWLDQVGINCDDAGFESPLTNNAHCGDKVIRYTVTGTSPGQPYVVSPRGPDDDTHHGAFKIAPSGTVSAMVSLASGGDQDFWVQPTARFLAWDGMGFTVVGVSVMGAPVHMTGDNSWTTITRIIDAAPGATHWYFDLAVSEDEAGTVVPEVDTVLYLDCAFIPDNGLSVAAEPYLDGYVVGTIHGDGIWEGEPHNSTSVYGSGEPEPEEPPDPDPSDGGDEGNPDAPDDPEEDVPTPPPPPLPEEPPAPITEEAKAKGILTRINPTGLCLDGDVQLGDLVMNRVDEFGVLWIVTDIEGWWNLPEPEIPDFPRGLDDGSYEARGRYTARIFTLMGSFFPSSKYDVRAARDRLVRAADLCHKGAWFATREPDATRASKVWLSGQPQISTINVNGRTDFSIGLKAPDPIKYGLLDGVLPGFDSRSMTSKNPVGNFGRTYEYGRTYPWSYGQTSSGGEIADEEVVTNTGNTRVYPVITVSGPTAGAINIFNSTTEQSTRVNRALAPDERLVIDGQNRTVSLNGAPNKRFYLDTVTDWIYLDPGPNTFYFTEEVGGATGTITVEWRSGWIG